MLKWLLLFGQGSPMEAEEGTGSSTVPAPTSQGVGTITIRRRRRGAGRVIDLTDDDWIVPQPPPQEIVPRIVIIGGGASFLVAPHGTGRGWIQQMIFAAGTSVISSTRSSGRAKLRLTGQGNSRIGDDWSEIEIVIGALEI